MFFNKISKIVLSPITATAKVIDKAFDAEDEDVRPSDFLTFGVSSAARVVNKITKEMDNCITGDEDYDYDYDEDYD
jgi:hypothetical protein